MLKDNERINIINEDLQLIENKDSLTFGTDAYFLSAFLPRHAKHIGVELGVGSGVISLLALTKKKCAHVYGFEVQEDISDIAKRNAELNGLDTKFTVINIFDSETTLLCAYKFCAIIRHRSELEGYIV